MILNSTGFEPRTWKLNPTRNLYTIGLRKCTHLSIYIKNIWQRVKKWLLREIGGWWHMSEIYIWRYQISCHRLNFGRSSNTVTTLVASVLKHWNLGCRFLTSQKMERRSVFWNISYLKKRSLDVSRNCIWVLGETEQHMDEIFQQSWPG